MVTLNLDQLSALESLAALRPGPAAVNAKRFAKAARRAERFARFEASARDGLRDSRQCSRRLVPHKGDGGAVSEWRMRRIIPSFLTSQIRGQRDRTTLLERITETIAHRV